MTKSYLWEQTRDLHHACEEHEVGAAMASGSPPIQWYADWLNAILEIHKVIDPAYSSVVQRVERLEDDLSSLLVYPVYPKDLHSAKQYATMISENKLAQDGAFYVMLGAHLMGGEIMRRRLEGYPTKHLEWEDRTLSLQELKKIKERTDIVDSARNCFSALLTIMDEIKST